MTSFSYSLHNTVPVLQREFRPILQKWTLLPPTRLWLFQPPLANSRFLFLDGDDGITVPIEIRVVNRVA